MEINSQLANKERTLKAITQGLQASNDIEEYLKVYHPKQ